MGYNYTALQTKIVRKIEKYGTTGSLQPSSITAVDANKPWKGNTTPTAVSVKVIMASVTDSDIKAFSMADEIGELKKAIIAVEAGVDPNADDILTVAGKAWKLVKGKKIAPNGTNVVFLFMVRR